jgi:hypothetical protein
MIMVVEENEVWKEQAMTNSRGARRTSPPPPFGGKISLENFMND